MVSFTVVCYVFVFSVIFCVSHEGCGWGCDFVGGGVCCVLLSLCGGLCVCWFVCV